MTKDEAEEIRKFLEGFSYYDILGKKIEPHCQQSHIGDILRSTSKSRSR